MTREAWEAPLARLVLGISSPGMFSKLGAVFSFPGRVLGISDKGFSGSEGLSLDSCQEIAVNKKTRAAREPLGLCPQGLVSSPGQPTPCIPELNLTLLWKPPAPL